MKKTSFVAPEKSTKERTFCAASTVGPSVLVSRERKYKIGMKQTPENA
jgi:hypothetical protein